MEFEVGASVRDRRFGTGIVTCVNTNLEYPISVRFDKDGSVERYTLSGKFDVEDLYPRLHREGAQVLAAPEPASCAFKQYDRVLVRESHKDNWKLALFLTTSENPNRPYCVYCDLALGTCNHFKFCIPFDSNKGRLNTKEEA